MGIPGALGGHLEVYSVSLGILDAPVAAPVGKPQVTNTWDPKSQTACYSYGASTAAQHDTILLLQFGAQTYVANLHSNNGVFDYPVLMADSPLKSPRLMTQVGAFSTFGWFAGFSTTKEPSWRGIRFLSTNTSAFVSDNQLTQVPTTNPFLAVGTYDLSTKLPTQGYSIVFDSPSSGVAYPATGTGATAGPVALSAPVNLDMQGITLTANAIPVTMGSVAYILDEAADTSIVAYTITPSSTNKLSTVAITSKAPSFRLVQSAASLNNKIVVYSVNNSSAPSLNVFDAVARTWTGPGLIGSGTSKQIPTTSNALPGGNIEDSKRLPVAPVVGGIAALVVIGLAAFGIVRRRHRRRQKAQVDTPPFEDEFSTQKLEMDPRLQKHEAANSRLPANPSQPPTFHHPSTTHSRSSHTQTSYASHPPPPLAINDDFESLPQLPFNPEYKEAEPLRGNSGSSAFPPSSSSPNPPYPTGSQQQPFTPWTGSTSY
ncbi:hypothetical protein BGX23_007683 [Mortierella sp. AD031]|nr:hypothetical protein BGX23_007683 [Mortierella sp. AD031]